MTPRSNELTAFLNASARFSTIGTFLLRALAGAYLGRYILAPVGTGILVGLTLGPLVSWLRRRGVSETTSSAGITVVLVLVVVAFVSAVAVPLESWSSRLPEMSEKLASHWQQISLPLEKLKALEQQMQEATAAAGRQPVAVAVQPRGFITDVISSAPDVAARFLLFIGTVFFFLASRHALRRGLTAAATTRHLRFAVSRWWRDSESYLSRYVATIALINLVFGLVVGLVMWGLGLPSPHLWGALAAVLNFALYIGPAVMAVVLLGVGLLTFDHVGWAVAPPLVFLAMNLIEGQFVAPAILGRTLAINPLVVFVALAFWLWLWGPIGAFIAVPLLIVLTIALQRMVPNPYELRPFLPRRCDRRGLIARR